MADNNALRNLQACIVEMECRHEGELKKLKANHNELKAHAHNESLYKFMNRFGQLIVQIKNLNPKVALHSMMLALRPSKFADSLCKKPPSSIDMLQDRAKGYIQMEEISRF
ncbi:hypothetical protein HKD37_15G043180 [Glycine soja]